MKRLYTLNINEQYEIKKLLVNDKTISWYVQIKIYHLGNEKHSIIINGKKGPEFDHIIYKGIPLLSPINPVKFSPDYKNFSYIANLGGHNIGKGPIIQIIGGKFFVILNGKKEQEFDDVNELTFSPNSKQFAYKVNSGGRFNIYGYDKDDDTLSFRELCLKVGNVITIQGGKEFVILNGNKCPEFDYIKFLTFSPDSKNFAYVAKKNGKEFVILNGNKGPEFNFIWDLKFSPDSKQFVYAVEKNNKWFVVLNGKQSPVFDYVHELTFSPNSKQFVYSTKTNKKKFFILENKKEFIMLNGIKGPEFDCMGELKFSPDSKQFAYIANLGGSFDIIGNSIGGRWFVILNDQKSQDFDTWPSYLTFSSNSKQFAYIGKNKKKKFVILNGIKGPEFDYVEELTFSPDSKQFAYLAEEMGNRFIILNDKRGHKFNSAHSLTFSLDSNKIAFIAEKNNKYFIILNNKKSAEKYEWLSPLKYYEREKCFLSLAINGENLNLVKMR